MDMFLRKKKVIFAKEVMTFHMIYFLTANNLNLQNDIYSKQKHIF